MRVLFELATALRRAILIPVLLGPATAAASVTVSEDPNTGLLSWKVQEHGFSLELVQLLPDFVRALYESRGFTPELIEGIARFCVFGSIAINESQGRLSYRVADWRYVTPDGAEHRLKTKSEWVAEWRAAGIPYNWSLLPDDQTFEVGDWNQGFTTVELPRESEFDLVYSWTVDGERHVATIEGMRCPPEQLSEQ